MAEKKKASQKSSSNVTRIKASDTTPAAVSEAPKKRITKTKESTETKQEKVKKKRSVKGIARPFVAIGRYFKGAWVELKQVRWPTRQATWGLTFAVLVYTAFFIVLILLLDVAFQYLFDLMLG